MIEDEKQKHVGKSNNIFADQPIKVNDIKKDEKIYKVAQKAQ